MRLSLVIPLTEHLVNNLLPVCACALPADSPQTVTVIPPVIPTASEVPASPSVSIETEIPSSIASAFPTDDNNYSGTWIPTASETLAASSVSIETEIPSSIASAYPTDDGNFSGTWIPTASEVPVASSTGVTAPVVTAGAGRSAQIGLGAGIAVAFVLL